MEPSAPRLPWLGHFLEQVESLERQGLLRSVLRRDRGTNTITGVLLTVAEVEPS